MIRYIIKRILLMIPVIIGVSFIVYALLDLAPGSAVDSIIFASENLSEEEIADLYRQYDLDKPMIYRYGKYMLRLVQGDLGKGDLNKLDVWEQYIRLLPNTLILSLTGMLIGSAAAIPLGIFSAKRAGKVSDNLTTIFTIVGISMPNFWLGILLLQLFSLKLGWLPAGGNSHGVLSLILPAICGALMLMMTATRQTRSSMLDVLHADYLRTARAKGVPEEVVIRKHALGNAMIPILTVLGSSLAHSFAGSAVVESVFSWPGIGRMAADAVRSRDVTTTLGCVIMTSIFLVVVQLIIDLLYGFVDPRIKAKYISKSKKSKASAFSVTAGAVSQATESADAAFPEVPCSISAFEPNYGSIAVSSDSSMEYAETAVSPDSDEPDRHETSAFVQPESTGQGLARDELTSLICATDDMDKTEQETVGVQVLDAVQERDRSVADTAKTAKSNRDNVLATRRFRKRSNFGELIHRLLKNKGAVLGLVLMGIMILVLIGSLFISYKQITQGNARERLTPPNLQHPFGIDNSGRDNFLRVIYGSRYSLAIGFGGSLIAALFGISLGSIAGYFGGATENIIMRLSEILASIPGLLLGMVIMAVAGNSFINLIIAAGVTSIPIYIRMARASILSVRNLEFVEAARAIGLRNIRIIFRQVLPNGMSPLIVTFSVNFGMMVLMASGLSFMGLGIPLPLPEWGSMISTGRDFARTAAYLMTFPGLFIMITVLASNLIGDGLRSALDPKLKGGR